MPNLKQRVADARQRIADALLLEVSMTPADERERELLLIADELLAGYEHIAQAHAPGELTAAVNAQAALTRLARVGLAQEVGDG
jgi:hypothetical protein